jgi:sterol desaturase/sphingolipid hydroxylase (fatty acid hydroxylase superfamily)
MLLSRFGYYTDFVAYPIVAIGLTAVNFTRPTQQISQWAAASALGLVVWSLLEYGIHRGVLHRLPFFSPMHATHHGAPLALIGTPTWVSIPVWCGTLLLPLWLLCGHDVATGTTSGVMLGYWWYGIVHHVIHHSAHNPLLSYFERRRAWHLRHHYQRASGNFGVTTSVWDHLFGSTISPLKERESRSKVTARITAAAAHRRVAR